MSVTADALRTLHRIHRQLSDLLERLQRGPKQIQARQAGVASVRAELEAVKADAKSARLTADRKNLDLKTGESKIRDLQTKLNTANSNKEYQALQDQIAAAEMANSVLSDEILEILERIDQLDAEVAQSQERLQKAETELAALEKQVSEKALSIREDIARLEQELSEAEDRLPGEIRAEYDRVVGARGEDGLAVVEEGVCGGCYHQIRANQMNELYMGRTVFCHACGRLLYLPEGVGPVRSGSHG